MNDKQEFKERKLNLKDLMNKKDLTNLNYQVKHQNLKIVICFGMELEPKM